MLSTPDKMAWPEHETLCLISIWGEDSIQAQIEGCTRKKEVYDRVATENPTEGLLRTAVLLHVLDACSLDCCIAREKKSCAILFWLALSEHRVNGGWLGSARHGSARLGTARLGSTPCSCKRGIADRETDVPGCTMAQAAELCAPCLFAFLDFRCLFSSFSETFQLS